MVAVAPDLREFCVSAVEQMAIDNKLLANSDELTINEAAYIYEQFIAGLWNSPLAQSDPDMWTRALKYAERAAAVAALHYLEQRLSTQHEHKLAGRQECDCYRTDTQRQRQQIQPTHTEVQTVDLAGDQARAVRHDEAECLAVMHKTVTSERTAAARMRNALGGLRQQGAPPVSDWAAPKDRERWTYEVQENLRTAAPVSQTIAMDGKVATMEDIARLLNETLDELDAQDAILGGGALNDDSSMLSSALDDSALGVAFGGSTLNSAHDRSTPGFALDGSSPSPTLNGPGGSMLGSAPVGSALDSTMLSSALDGLNGSPLSSALDDFGGFIGGSALSLALD